MQRILDEASPSIRPATREFTRPIRRRTRGQFGGLFFLRLIEFRLSAHRPVCRSLQPIGVLHILNSLVTTLFVLLDRLTAWWLGPSAARLLGSAGQASYVVTLGLPFGANGARKGHRRMSSLVHRPLASIIQLNGSGWRRILAGPPGLSRRSGHARRRLPGSIAAAIAQARSGFLRIHSPSIVLSR
jgi:hypothetical protein